MTNISTLRPGLLVSLKTSIKGNVAYRKAIIDAAHIVDDGAEQERWETERTITDPVEYEAARKARSKAAGAIRAICAHSAFGMLCPESAAEELEAAIRKATEIADEFNEGAALTRISVNVLTGRIAPDDVEAVKAINSELRDFLEDMERGVRNLDVKVIREAATRAKEIGAMLSPDAAARVQIAVDAARMAAKRIVQAGDQAAAEIDMRAVRAITEARTAFLDLDGGAEVAAPAPEQRALDLTPAAAIAAPAPATANIEV